MGEIGQVTVGVVPDARAFWARFREQTSGQADAQGRRDGDEWRRGFQGSAERGSVKVKVDADTTPAKAKIEDLKKQGDQAGLLKTLLPLAPALAPLAGAAAASGVALGAMGATAILALKGAQAAMKAGTADGQKFAAGVGTIKAALSGLENTAAHGALNGFQQSITSVTAAFPALNAETAAVSQQLGSIGSHLIGGIAGGFSSFGPVIQQVLTYVDQLASKFQSWAGGPGGTKFASVLSDDFRQAVPVLESLATAAVHIVDALNSGGQGSLSFLGQFSSLAAHIPVSWIQAGTTAYLAFRAAVTVTTGLTAASTALKGFAASEALAASAGGAMAARTVAGMGAFIGKATPYIAGLVAADFALRALVKTNNAWSQSNNAVKNVIGQEGAAFSALARFQNPFSAMDANNSAKDFSNALQPIIETYQRIREEDLQLGKGTLYGSAEPYAAHNLAVVTRNAGLLSDALGGMGVNLATAGQSIKDYQTSLATASAGEQKWLTQGKDSGKVIAGVAVYTGTWAAAVKESGGNAATAADLIAAHADALRDDQAAAAKAATESARLNAAVSATASKYHLTADQVSMYGAALGVTAQQVATGEITARQFSRAVGGVARAFANGNDAVQSWLTSLSKIDLTQNTLSTRVQILGAGLKALQGVTLDMAGANLQAVSSVQDVATAIGKNSNSIGRNGQLLGQLTRTAHGFVVEQPKLTAGSLAIEQAMSQAGSSAITLAQNIYQNTGSAKKAGDAYYGLRRSLIQNLVQMGYFPGKARKIADSVYGIPNKKFVSFLQKGDLPSAIRTLSSALSTFTRQFNKILVYLGINDHASTPLHNIHDILNDIPSVKTVDVYTNVHDAVNSIPKATGGSVWGPGTGTSDSIPARLSNGEFVVKASQASKHRGLLENINQGAQGFAAGGPVGNAQQIASALRSAFGLNRNQIAGFLGNFQVESGFSPRAYNARENAHGIAQWEGSRWTALQQYATHMGLQATSMAAQTGFLVKELRGSGLVSQVKRMSDPARVAAFIDAHYERSSGSTRGARVAAARAFAARGVAGGVGASASASKAQVQSTNALVPDAHSLFGALSGSVGDMRKAAAAFIKDFRAAGATTRQIARATADDARLVANQQKLVAARSKLANITTYGDTVRGSLTGGFDPTKFGSVADLIGGYQGQTDQNNAYTKEVNALRKRAGKDGSALGLINTLAASGQTASLEALYSGSARDLTNAGKAYSGYNTSVQGGVDAASTAKYGETQGQASRDVDRLVAHGERVLHALAQLGATVARSHGSSGARVEREMAKFAHEMSVLVDNGRKGHA